MTLKKNFTKKLNWYETWFDSPYYEMVYAHRNKKESQKFIKWLHTLIPSNIYPNILDLACGNGRNTIELSHYGYNVTGMDLSKQRIQNCIENAKKNKTQNIQFKQADMRHPFDDKYHAIINVFTSMGYFKNVSDNITILSNIYEALHKHGKFFIDFLNPTYIKNHLKPFETWNHGNISIKINREIDDDNFVIKYISIKEPNQDEEKHFEERVQLLDISWFKNILLSLNFQIENIYGNYKGDPFDINNSQHMCILTCKN